MHDLKNRLLRICPYNHACGINYTYAAVRPGRKIVGRFISDANLCAVLPAYLNYPLREITFLKQ